MILRGGSDSPNFTPITINECVSRVYPNPAKDYFVIEFSEMFEVERIDMVDPLGKVYPPALIERSDSRLVIDVSNLSNGAHIVRLRTDKGSASFRVVVE